LSIQAHLTYDVLPARVLLNPVEASGYIRKSVSSLAKLRVYGGGPRYLKNGRRVFYERADLDAWLDARVRTSTSDNGK
jgi:hypothetical protein